jgi:hypothetical protein
MRMGQALRDSKGWSNAGAKKAKPAAIPAETIIGRVSLDLTMSYAWPRVAELANAALKNYSEEWMRYEDSLRQMDFETVAEIGVDGSVRSGGTAEPIRPLFDSQFKIDELSSTFQDASDHFFAKKGASWLVHADAARFERTLDERYGVFRPFITNHPEIEQLIRSIQRKYAMGYFSPFRQGSPPISRPTAVVILFMMQRGGVRWEVLTLATLFFLVGLQPWPLVAIICLVQYLFHRRRNQKIGQMKKFSTVPTTAPYYRRQDDSSSDKNSYLLRNVGNPLIEKEEIDTSMYDTIIIGTGPATLYAGALLSRAGRRVLVLSGAKDASGCLNFQDKMDSDEVRQRWADVPLDVRVSDVTKVSGQQHLLAPALASSTDAQGGVRFAKIGSDGDDHAYCILSIPGMGAETPTQQVPFVLKADGGLATLMDDAASLLGDNYHASDSLVGQYYTAMEKVNQSNILFYLSKILPDAVNKLRSDNDYHNASLRECEALLNACFPLNAHLRSLMAGIGMRGENLVPANTSTAAHVSNICSLLSEEGLHYPIGGPRSLCHALASTIEQYGGRVVTEAPALGLVFDESLKVTPPSSMPKMDPKEPDAPCCVGVEIAGSRIVRFGSERYNGDSSVPVVISMEGLISTFIRLIPDDIRKTYKVPRGIPALSERRPLIHFLFGLKGSAEQLEVTGADYYRLPNAALPRDEADPDTGAVTHGSIGWMVNENRPKRFTTADSAGEEDDEAVVVQPNKKKRPVTFDQGHSWMRISFPSAKDPSFQQRHGDITTCVVTIEADDNFVRPFDTKPAIYLPQQNLQSNTEAILRLAGQVKADLFHIFPQLVDRVEHAEIRGPISAGLSHTPERYVAKGVRADCPYPCLYTGGSDLVIGDSFSSETVGAWLVANAVCGYNAIDYLLLQKHITSDLARFMVQPTYDDGEDVAVDYEPTAPAPGAVDGESDGL